MRRSPLFLWRVGGVDLYECYRGRAGSGRSDRASHDGVLQPLGTDELEACLLVHRARSVVDERVAHRLLTYLVRIPLDHPATLRGDLIERPGQGDLGVAVLAETLVDEDAVMR